MVGNKWASQIIGLIGRGSDYVEHGVTFVSVICALAIISYSISGNKPLDAILMPAIIAVALVSLVLFQSAIVHFDIRLQRLEKQQENPLVELDSDDHDLQAVIYVTLLILSSAVLLPVGGFYLGYFAFILVFLYLYNGSPLLQSTLLSAITMLIVYVIFEELLYVGLSNIGGILLGS